MRSDNRSETPSSAATCPPPTLTLVLTDLETAERVPPCIQLELLERQNSTRILGQHLLDVLLGRTRATEIRQ